MRSWLAALALFLTGCDEAETLRIATYNLHLARGEPGALIAELEAGSAQVEAVVAAIAAADPDILLVNELDHDREGRALGLLRERLKAAGSDYAYAFTAPVNTGVPTGLDLDGDGETTGPADRQGWGVFEGQFGMAILSRVPILTGEARTFQRMLWAGMPDALYPEGHFPAAAAARLRLSSKSHWDVPLHVGARRIHLLASHPTPPVFDGPEDRNGRRNHDEIAFWRHYLDGADWIEDDGGQRGGLSTDAAFVVLGDLNSDPTHGDGRHGAIRALLAHPRIADPQPRSGGSTATASWDSTGPLRVDYVLPSRGLDVTASGIAPANAEASDHRLVWIDIRL